MPGGGVIAVKRRHLTDPLRIFVVKTLLLTVDRIKTGSLLKSKLPERNNRRFSSLEDELNQHLCSTGVVVLVRGVYLTKSKRPWIHYWTREQWMVEGVDE